MDAGNGLPSSSHALVPVGPADEPHRLRRVQRQAPFLAQLIAAARQLPQARERRRADPCEVIAAYQATIAKLHALNRQ